MPVKSTFKMSLHSNQHKEITMSKKIKLPKYRAYAEGKEADLYLVTDNQNHLGYRLTKVAQKVLIVVQKSSGSGSKRTVNSQIS